MTQYFPTNESNKLTQHGIKGHDTKTVCEDDADSCKLKVSPKCSEN